MRFFCEDFRLYSRYNNVNYGARHVYKPLFGPFVAIYRLACSEISLSIDEKKARKKTWKWADIVQFGRWRDLAKSSSPFPGLVLNPLEETLLQPLLKTFIKVFIMIERWKIN